MQRLRSSIVSGLLCCFGLAACSENPNDVKRLNGARGTVITSTQTLDQSIRGLLALFPRSLDQRDPNSEGPDLNPRATWDQIQQKYASGLSKPAHMVIAKRKLVRLSDWATRNAGMMSPPPNLETKAGASSRLVLYMNMYVYGGPGGTPPDFIPGADVAVGIVTPDAPATIVTPTKHAGVQLEAGSVDENTVVVVTQNPTVFPAVCSGPLDTKLCQYPQFYTFDQFPHKTLLKPAKFNVCHVNTGDTRRPLADHDRLRLAHTKPENPADYTEGSTIRDGIEILPLVPQTFSTCEGSAYQIETEVGLGETGVLSRVARAIRKIATPKPAYAIDLGLGGIAKRFSAFNDVDPIGRPDLSVARLIIVSGCGEVECVANPGGRITLNYQVKNIGTATSARVPFNIRLASVPANPEDPGIPVQLALFSGNVSALLPNGTQSNIEFSVPIPATAQPGAYNIQFVVGDNEAFPEASDTHANDAASAPITIRSTSPFIDLGVVAGDNISAGLAINAVGHAVGRSQNGEASARPFIWIDGVMTSLGSLGGTYGEAEAINIHDEVVGISKIANGSDRAFYWRNGVMTNLGTLAGANDSHATGINNNGVVIGYSGGRGWRWDGETMTELVPAPGFVFMTPTGINDAGQIVGFALMEGGGTRGWIWQNGSFTLLSTLGGDIPYAINNGGTIIGYTLPTGAGFFRAVRWVDGVIADIGAIPGDQSSAASAISDDGRIVGSSYSDTGVHGALWQNGQVIDIGSFGGGGFVDPRGINANGQIVGRTVTSGGTLHAVIWQAPPLQ